MSKVIEAMQHKVLEDAFQQAQRHLPSEMKTRFVAVYFDGETIRARRQLADGSPSGWVDVGALLGKRGEEGGSIDAGVEASIRALWPEAEKGFVRMLRIVANAAARFGGLF